MKISDILSSSAVFTDVKAENKRELLVSLARQMAAMESLDEHLVVDSVLERENLGSTGYGNGTAFPHARIDGARRVRAVFARLDTPIDFDSIDHEPVDLVFLLVSPENSGADHLAALAELSRVLKNEDVCHKLRQAKTKEKIFSILNG